MLCSILGLDKHSLTSKERTQLAFEGDKVENQRRPKYRFGEGHVADEQQSKTSTVQPVRGFSQYVTIHLPTLHNYGSLFDATHMISRTRLPLFSLVCVEKYQEAWGRG